MTTPARAPVAGWPETAAAAAHGLKTHLSIIVAEPAHVLVVDAACRSRRDKQARDFFFDEAVSEVLKEQVMSRARPRWRDNAADGPRSEVLRSGANLAGCETPPGYSRFRPAVASSARLSCRAGWSMFPNRWSLRWGLQRRSNPLDVVHETYVEDAFRRSTPTPYHGRPF